MSDDAGVVVELVVVSLVPFASSTLCCKVPRFSSIVCRDTSSLKFLYASVLVPSLQRTSSRSLNLSLICFVILHRPAITIAFCSMYFWFAFNGIAHIHIIYLHFPILAVLRYQAFYFAVEGWKIAFLPIPSAGVSLVAGEGVQPLRLCRFTSCYPATRLVASNVTLHALQSCGYGRSTAGVAWLCRFLVALHIPRPQEESTERPSWSLLHHHGPTFEISRTLVNWVPGVWKNVDAVACGRVLVWRLETLNSVSKKPTSYLQDQYAQSDDISILPTLRKILAISTSRIK